MHRMRWPSLFICCGGDQLSPAGKYLSSCHSETSPNWSWESAFLSGRRTGPVIRVGAAAGLLLSQFPLRPLSNETLEGKGSPETIGVWRLFCPLFQLLGKVGRRRHVSYVKKLIERKLPAGGTKEAVGKKYAVGDKRGKNCRRVGCRQHTIDEQGQVHLPSMVTKGEENGAGILLPLTYESVISSSAHHRGCP